MKAYLANVYIINFNGSFSGFHNSEYGLNESRFPTACPSHNTNLLSSWKLAGVPFHKEPLLDTVVKSWADKSVNMGSCPRVTTLCRKCQISFFLVSNKSIKG